MVFAPFLLLRVRFVQNDFFRGGLLPLDAEAVIPVINGLRKRRFDVVVYGTLERAVGFEGFASANPVSLYT